MSPAIRAGFPGPRRRKAASQPLEPAVSDPGTFAPQYQPPYLPGPGGLSPGPLQVGVHRHTAGWVVVLIGELDIATAPALTGRLVRSDGAAPSHLVADLSGLGFCDCAGLGALVGVHRRAV